MNENIKSLLDEEIVSEIEELGSLTPGSNEHTAVIDSLVKLYKLRIEETKNEMDFEEKSERRKMEEEQYDADLEMKKHQIGETESADYDDRRLKEEQLKEQIKDRYFRLGVEAAGIILPLMFYAIWMNKGFKFEETGTFTSTTFRGLFNRFRPTKK